MSEWRNGWMEVNNHCFSPTTGLQCHWFILNKGRKQVIIMCCHQNHKLSCILKVVCAFLSSNILFLCNSVTCLKGCYTQRKYNRHCWRVHSYTKSNICTKKFYFLKAFWASNESMHSLSDSLPHIVLIPSLGDYLEHP